MNANAESGNGDDAFVNAERVECRRYPVRVRFIVLHGDGPRTTKIRLTANEARALIAELERAIGASS